MTRSPQPLAFISGDTIIFAQPAVFIRCQPDNIRLRIPMITSPSGTCAGDLERGPAFGLRHTFSRYVEGPFLGRDKFLGAFKAPRTSSLLNSSQEPSSGIAYRFKFLRGLVALVHDENSNRGAKAKWTEIFSLRSVK